MTTATIALTARPAPGVRWARSRMSLAEAGRVLLYALLAVALLLFGFLAVGPRVFGYRTVTMLTGSMRPLIPPGAVAIDVAEPVSSLRPGQVVSFHAPEDGHPVITHRVVSVMRRDGRVLIRTKGDANSAPDPWLAVVHGTKVWRVRGSVPFLGYAVHALRAGSTRVVVVWLVPAAALLWLLVGIWRPSGDATSDSFDANTASGAEGGEPECLDPASAAPPARPSPSRSSSRRRSTSRSRSRKRRQRQMRNSRRRQRRSTRR